MIKYKQKLIDAIEEMRPLNSNDTDVELSEQLIYNNIIDLVTELPIDFDLSKQYDKKRIEKIVEADEQGNCIVLPCKIGDTLSQIYFDNNGLIHINSGEVVAINIDKDGYKIKISNTPNYVEEKEHYKFAPIADILNTLPFILADFYIGDNGEIKKILETTYKD